LKSRSGSVATLGGACFRFSATHPGRPLQIRLRVAAGEASAAVLVETRPAPQGTARYLAAGLVPRRGPSSSVPVELLVPPSGVGYLSDNNPRPKLVLTWTAGTPLTLCGVSAPA
jgi:hypothetical protein